MNVSSNGYIGIWMEKPEFPPDLFLESVTMSQWGRRKRFQLRGAPVVLKDSVHGKVLWCSTDNAARLRLQHRKAMSELG